MESVISEVLRRTHRSSLQGVLSDFVQMVPINQRSMLLQKIYNEYGLWLRQRKACFCESVQRALEESRIPTTLLDRYRRRDSVRYELTTTRLREYIRHRNRRVKDDLLWACMYVALIQDDLSASKQMRHRILELARNLEERLAKVKTFLELEQREETIDHDISTIPEEYLTEIIDTALLKGLPERQVSEFLAKRFERTPSRLNEDDRIQIRKRIDSKMKRCFKDTVVGQSEGLKDSVQNLIERKFRLTHSDLVSCAMRGFKETRRIRKSRASKILETFTANVLALMRARSIRFIDQAIDETLGRTGVVAR